MSPRRPDLLFVPGGFHGAWVWDEVCALLHEDGWQARTVELPSTAGGNPRIGMYDDTAALRRSLGRFGPPTTIVAHAYGGIPATQAALRLGHVVKLVYVAAFQLNKGESLLSAMGWQVPPWWVLEGQRVHAGDPLQTFYGDVSPHVAARYEKRLRPTNLSAALEPITEPTARQLESSYVICEQNRALPLDRQVDMASRADTVYRLPGGHSPMLARPAELASLLTQIVWPQDHGPKTTRIESTNER